LTDPQVNKAISDFYDIEKNATQVANLFSRYKSTGQGEMMREMIADPEQRIGRPRQLYRGSAQRDLPSQHR
jgi:citrate synthase